MGGFAQQPRGRPADKPGKDAARAAERAAFPEWLVLDALLRRGGNARQVGARADLEEAVTRLVRLRTGRTTRLDLQKADDRALLEALLASLEDTELTHLRGLAQSVVDDGPAGVGVGSGDGDVSFSPGDQSFGPPPSRGGVGAGPTRGGGLSWPRIDLRDWLGRLRNVDQPSARPVPPEQRPRLARPGREADVALQAEGPDGTLRELDPYLPLRTGAQVDVVVRIGAPFAQSLFAGQRPGVDTVLGPNTVPRELVVSLLSTDFTVVGEAQQYLVLPADGPSEEVRLSVVAPSRPMLATARLSLHHKGNVVQTVRITATVRRAARRMRGRAVSAEVEHLSPGGLPAARELRPRALSVVLNETSGVHVLYTHTRDGVACPLALPPAVALAAAETRATLEKAMRDWDYDAAVRSLAARGSNLWRYLFDQTAVREHVRALLAARDETVQVLRVDPDSSLPWALVYDRSLPADTAVLPVCRDLACTHADDGAQVCLNGFWGIRLRIEELLADRAGAPLEAVAVGATGPPVFLAAGVVDAFSKEVPSSLAPLSVGPLPLESWPPDPALVDALWGSQRRPVCVVVAHHERVAGGGTVRADSVLRSQDGSLVLSAAKLSEAAVRRGDWADPRPLVVLLGCSTSAPPTGQDLGGFLSAMLGARASGVIGTECTLNTSALPPMANALAHALLTTVGPDGVANVLPMAAQDMRRKLAAAGDIAGLAITAVGSFCPVPAS